MTDPAVAEAGWCQSGWLLALILPAAAAAGMFLDRWVARLTADGGPSRRPIRPGLLAAGAAATAAAALWWWEVHQLGQFPAEAAAAGPGPVCLRFVAHLIVFGLLAAAAAVDLRERVIPDAITVPGVLAGLAWNAMLPATLLPIGHGVERSFAPPRIVPDALAAWGPLQHAAPPAWLGGPVGLLAALAAFAAWWAFGLPAADGEPEAADRRLRAAVGGAGVAGITAAWWAGGDHWAGLATALAGLVVAGGVVWATRVGASRALGREALGFGDVTLMAMAGAWLGWQACLLACGLGVFIGLAHGILQIVRHSDSELPFGPSLCLGLALAVVCWRPLWFAAGPQFERPLELAAVVAAVILMTALTLWAWSRLRGRGGAAA